MIASPTQLTGKRDAYAIWLSSPYVEYGHGENCHYERSLFELKNTITLYGICHQEAGGQSAQCTPTAVASRRNSPPSPSPIELETLATIENGPLTKNQLNVVIAQGLFWHDR